MRIKEGDERKKVGELKKIAGECKKDEWEEWKMNIRSTALRGEREKKEKLENSFKLCSDFSGLEIWGTNENWTH